MAKTKKLTTSALKKMDAKNYNKKKVINVQGFDVTIDEVFRPSKLQAAFSELLEQMFYVQNEPDIDNKMFQQLWPYYIQFLLIKYFTDFEIPDKLEDQITIMLYLVDNYFFEAIIEAFNESEINKWKDMIENADQYYAQIIDFAIDYEQQNNTGIESAGSDENASEESINIVRSDSGQNY